MTTSIRYGTDSGKDGKDFFIKATEDLPNTASFGEGTLQRGLEFYTSDGTAFSQIGSFTPSIYSGAKSATTTVTGQSELFATGATKFEAAHVSTSYDLIIGFGNTTAEAEIACSTGTEGKNKFLLLRTGVTGIPVTLRRDIGTYKAVAWLGVGGTVAWLSNQGV